MALERARSVFKRQPKDHDPGPISPVVGPNGIVESHPEPQHHHEHPKPHTTDHHHHHAAHRPPHHQHAGPPEPGDGQQAPLTTTPATRSGRLQVALHNDTTSNDVYAYITGQAIDRGNALFLLSADAETGYYPQSPAATGTRLTQDISIDLGPPGNVVYATIPRLAGGRIWFSNGAPLNFALNPGPGLVEPSIFNQADPNHNTNFGFAEFTFNNAQVFANISYVDFVGLPVAMTLEDTNRTTQHVSGIPGDGLQRIADGLRAQTARDGRRWSSLIINNKNGHLLRILSPNSAVLLNPSWFQTYWTSYVNEVYNRYTSQHLTVDTQASFGNANAVVEGGSNLNFGGGGSFPKPSAADIFSCSSGPFATGGNSETNAIIPRLAAAFNRSTLLITNNQPDGAEPRQYYRNPTTNHYARVVHQNNLDGKGYAFPYDDVTPDGGVPQEGAVFSYSPALLTVSVGGRSAHV